MQTRIGVVIVRPAIRNSSKLGVRWKFGAQMRNNGVITSHYAMPGTHAAGDTFLDIGHFNLFRGIGIS